MGRNASRKVAVRVTVAALFLLGCGGAQRADGEADADTLTRRQKDSIVSTLPVPGAGAVGKALDAADAAQARAERHDTIG